MYGIVSEAAQFDQNNCNIDKSGWIDDLQFDVFLNNISVIAGRWKYDNKRRCAMEPRLRLKNMLASGSRTRDC